MNINFSGKKISNFRCLFPFNVIGTSGNLYTVRLFPEQSSSCPSTTTCYHIVGARMSIGLGNSSQKQKNQFVSIEESQPQKKSGRKAPRKEDYEVGCAPDSE